MNSFSDALRSHRKSRRLSQLELAVNAEVSARHICFLETGRARPSREMILRLGDALQLSLAARNQLLLQAGFAARYPARSWDAEAMLPIRLAIDRLLERHEPYPAFAMDRCWIVQRLNSTAAALFAIHKLTVGSNLLDALLSADMQTAMENWPEVAHHTALRLRTESAAQGGVAKLDKAAEQLARVPYDSDPVTGPVVPVIYRLGDQHLSLFSTLTQFGTQEDLLLDELKIEMLFPADEASAEVLQTMGASRSGLMAR